MSGSALFADLRHRLHTTMREEADKYCLLQPRVAQPTNFRFSEQRSAITMYAADNFTARVRFSLLAPNPTARSWPHLSTDTSLWALSVARPMRMGHLLARPTGNERSSSPMVNRKFAVARIYT